MERSQRIVFAAIAAVIAVVAVVVLAGGSDEQTNRADRAPATAAGETSTPEPQAAEPRATATATPTREPKPEVQTIRYRDGEVVGGRARVEADKGETVTFAVESDVAEEIHVHGYDRYVDIPAGRSKRISFPADIEGIFEVELHDAGIELAQLRVNP